MSKTFEFTLDGRVIQAESGQSIMQAADEAGVYIPRLCDVEGLEPEGSCRVCTVKVNGRFAAACTQPAEPGALVESETEEINHHRRMLVQMLFHEGNHLCPICEASGNCELQAMAYRLGIHQPTRFPYLQPVRPVDASHPDIMLDYNRCIRCGRCIRASAHVDGKHIFEFVGRGISKQIGIDADSLAETGASLDDLTFSAGLCPVGCILRKGQGFATPIGQRRFDHEPIGSDIEARGKEPQS